MATPEGYRPADIHARTIPEEARAFQGDRAGIVTRVAANTVDLIVSASIVLSGWIGWAALQFLFSPRSFAFPPIRWGVVLIALSLVLWLNLWLSWATTGRTYGDHLMGLRVVNYRGRKMHWGGALVRAAFCVVFPIGLFWVAVSKENRSVQDTVLRTSVIYDWARGPALSRLTQQ